MNTFFLYVVEKVLVSYPKKFHEEKIALFFVNTKRSLNIRVFNHMPFGI